MVVNFYLKKDSINTNTEIINIEQKIENFFYNTAIDSLKTHPYKENEIFEKDIQNIFIHNIMIERHYINSIDKKTELEIEFKKYFDNILNTFEIEKYTYIFNTFQITRYNITTSKSKNKQKELANLDKQEQKELENFLTNTIEKKALVDKFLNYRKNNQTI